MERHIAAYVGQIRIPVVICRVEVVAESALPVATELK